MFSLVNGIDKVPRSWLIYSANKKQIKRQITLKRQSFNSTYSKAHIKKLSDTLKRAACSAYSSRNKIEEKDYLQAKRTAVVQKQG
jgi:hypothetical protein